MQQNLIPPWAEGQDPEVFKKQTEAVKNRGFPPSIIWKKPLSKNHILGWKGVVDLGYHSSARPQVPEARVVAERMATPKFGGHGGISYKAKTRKTPLVRTPGEEEVTAHLRNKRNSKYAKYAKKWNKFPWLFSVGRWASAYLKTSCLVACTLFKWKARVPLWPDSLPGGLAAKISR